MADTKNTEVLPASEPPAPVQTAAPTTVVREKSNWATALIAALVVVAALVLGGVGGYALAAVTQGGGRPAMQQGQGPGQQGGPQQGPRPQQGPQQGPGGQQGPRPERPMDDSNESNEEDESTTEDESTEG